MEQTQIHEDAASVSVRSLLIPLEGMNLVVPNTSVAEVALLGTCTPASGSDWLLGTIHWRGLEIPLISFERFIGEAPEGGERNSRAIVLNTLNGNMALPFIALRSQGLPRLVQADGNVLQQGLEEAELPQGVLCRARLYGDEVLIPDFDLLEGAYLQQGAATAAASIE